MKSMLPLQPVAITARPRAMGFGHQETKTLAAMQRSQVSLAWNDNASNEFSYNIERATSSSGPWVLVGNVASNVTTFASANLASCATYHYRVRAYNLAGYSDYSNVANGTTTGCAPAAPSAPAGLTASAVADDTIVLRWTDTASTESSFKAQRATTSAGPWKTIRTATADATMYTSGGLAGATVYYYRVRAENSAGQSSWTTVVSAAGPWSAASPDCRPARFRSSEVW